MLHVDGACQANRAEYKNMLAQSQKMHALTRGQKTAVVGSFSEQVACAMTNLRLVLSGCARRGLQLSWKNRRRLLELRQH